MRFSNALLATFLAGFVTGRITETPTVVPTRPTSSLNYTRLQDSTTTYTSPVGLLGLPFTFTDKESTLFNIPLGEDVQMTVEFSVTKADPLDAAATFYYLPDDDPTTVHLNREGSDLVVRLPYYGPGFTGFTHMDRIAKQTPRALPSVVTVLKMQDELSTLDGTTNSDPDVETIYTTVTVNYGQAIGSIGDTKTDAAHITQTPNADTEMVKTLILGPSTTITLLEPHEIDNTDDGVTTIKHTVTINEPHELGGTDGGASATVQTIALDGSHERSEVDDTVTGIEYVGPSTTVQLVAVETTITSTITPEQRTYIKTLATIVPAAVTTVTKTVYMSPQDAARDSDSPLKATDRSWLARKMSSVFGSDSWLRRNFWNMVFFAFVLLPLMYLVYQCCRLCWYGYGSNRPQPNLTRTPQPADNTGHRNPWRMRTISESSREGGNRDTHDNADNRGTVSRRAEEGRGRVNPPNTVVEEVITTGSSA